MTSVDMHPDTLRAIREELAAIGGPRSRLQRRRRRMRLFAVGVGAILVAGLSTGAAVVVAHFPGSTTVTPIGGLHAATHTGSGVLELGPVPAGATRVIVTVRCLNTQGSLSIPAVPESKGSMSGATFFCRGGGRVDSHGHVHPWRMDDALLPAAGTTTIPITAEPGTSWAVVGQYAGSSTTPWSRNAKGQTYGQCNVHGCPDLVGAQATNGKIGFILDSEMSAIRGSGYLPVYTSDGTTVIGRFSIGTPTPTP
jgi:hypothetical protein